MARVRFGDQWFDEIDPRAFYEAGFEAVIRQNADLLRPGARLVPFKQPVYASRDRCKIPDLALIDQDYRFWWVIEVEMGHHPLELHVLPQVEAFVDGDYNNQHVDALLRADPTLDPQKLAHMLLGEPPRVVVIADTFNAQWALELKALDVSYAVFRIFRSSLNREVVYFEGKLPDHAAEHVTRLIPSRIPRYFKVLSPAALPVGSDERVDLLVDGKLTLWRRLMTKTDCFLIPQKNVPVPHDRPYVVVRDDEGRLNMQAERKLRR